MTKESWTSVSVLYLHFLQFVDSNERILVFLRLSKQHTKEMNSKEAMKTVWQDCKFTMINCDSISEIPKYVTSISIIHESLSQRAISRWNFQNIHSLEDPFECYDWNLLREAPLLRTLHLREKTVPAILQTQVKELLLWHHSLFDFSYYSSLTVLTLWCYDKMDVSKFIFLPQLRILKLRAVRLEFSSTSYFQWNQIEEFWWQSYEPGESMFNLKEVLIRMPKLNSIHLFCFHFNLFPPLLDCKPLTVSPISNDLMQWLSENTQNRVHFEHLAHCHQNQIHGINEPHLQRSNCSLGALFAGVTSLDHKEAMAFELFQSIKWESSDIDQVQAWYKESSFCRKTTEFLWSRLESLVKS